MVTVMLWYWRLRLRRLERLMGAKFDGKLSGKIDACIEVIEALEVFHDDP